MRSFGRAFPASSRFFPSVLTVLLAFPATLAVAGCELVVDPSVQASGSTTAATAVGASGSSASAGSVAASTGTEITGSSGGSGASGTSSSTSTAGSSGSSSAVGSSGSSGSASSSSGSGSTASGSSSSSSSTGSSSSGSSTGTNGTTCSTLPPASERWVDASAAPGGNGNSSCPFVTITAALGSVAGANTPVTIHVAAGTYNQGLGETFPLVIPGFVTVKGEGGSSRNNFTIDGAGTPPLAQERFTVELRGALNYVRVRNSSSSQGGSDYIVAARGGSPHLSFVTIDGTNANTAALFITSADSSAAVVTMDQQSEVTSSDSDGILIRPGFTSAPQVTITGTKIDGNKGNGVTILDPNPGSTANFRPSLDGQADMNTIQCNTGYGVSSVISVDAEYNVWNHAPNAITSTPPNADVNNTTLVDTANAVAPTIPPQCIAVTGI